MKEEKEEKIAGRYNLLSVLGKGNIGAVYKCHDPVMNNTVAIKVLIDQSESSSAKRFHLEAKATASLEHENIVKIIDFGQYESQLYLVLEYCQGKSLEEIIETEKLPITDAIEIFRQIARGMNYANKNKILHRDLKPSNIILVRDSKNKPLAKIVDFGLAKVKSENQNLTGPGMAVGSPAYMSPEAAQGDSLDPRSDIFSMGCLMFETISGQLPFEAETQLESIMNRVDGEAMSLATVTNESVPKELIELVDKCLAKNPDDRVQSFSTLEQKLNELLNLEIRSSSTQDAIEPSASIDLNISESSPKLKMSVIFGVIALVILIVSLFPILSMVSENKSIQPKASPPDSVLPVVQFTDLKIQEKIVQEDGKKWNSIWGASSVKDTSILIGRTDIKNLKVLESHLEGKESDFLATLSLDALNLKLSSLSDYCFKNVGKNHSLEYLKLDRAAGITSDGISELLNCPHLKVLILRKTEASDEFIPIFAKMSHLENLDISHCMNITGKDIHLLNACKNLKELKLGDCNLSLGQYANKKPPLKVKKLLLNNTGITDSDMDYISKFKVEVLNLKENSISVDALEKLSKNKTLKMLFVDRPKNISRKRLKDFIQKFKNYHIYF